MPGARGLGGTAIQERGFVTRDACGGHADATGARARRHRDTGARVSNPRRLWVTPTPGVRGLGGTAIQERGFLTRDAWGSRQRQGIGTADGAFGVLVESDFADAHCGQVEREKAIGQQFARANQELQCFGGLDAA
jgi:hypothetical protein